jgi:hypothetical protein
MLPLLTYQTVAYAGLLLAAWLAGVVVYRRFFHPLAKVPGPFLASVTRLYCFYYNVIEGGVFYLEIERLHELYGTVSKFSSASTAEGVSSRLEESSQIRCRLGDPSTLC